MRVFGHRTKRHISLRSIERISAKFFPRTRRWRAGWSRCSGTAGKKSEQKNRPLMRSVFCWLPLLDSNSAKLRAFRLSSKEFLPKFFPLFLPSVGAGRRYTSNPKRRAKTKNGVLLDSVSVLCLEVKMTTLRKSLKLPPHFY